MEKSRKLELKCPHCGSTFRHAFPRVIDADRDHSMKDEVLSGDLFALACPSCMRRTAVLFPLLYHDPSRRFMIQLLEGEEDGDPFGKALDTMQEEDEIMEHILKRSYVMRLVRHPNDLTEKIILLEEGRDDRAVEILKARMLESGGIPGVTGFLYSPGEEHPGFVAESEEGFIGEVGMDEEAYEEIRSKVLPLLSEQTLQSRTIDAAWAERALAEAEKHEMTGRK